VAAIAYSNGVRRVRNFGLDRNSVTSSTGVQSVQSGAVARGIIGAAVIPEIITKWGICRSLVGTGYNGTQFGPVWSRYYQITKIRVTKI